MAAELQAALFVLGIVLVAVRFAGELARRAGQPAVAGEILAGIILGPSVLGFVGPFGAEASAEMDAVEVVAQLGVLILLFEIGLGSSLTELRKVGPSAGLVGSAGFVFGLGAGFIASAYLATQTVWIHTEAASARPWLLHLFIGAVLAVTSVGINARTLGELGKIRTAEARVILGAAMFGDVLALIVLAAVGTVATGSAAGFPAGWALAFKVGVFLSVVLVGLWMAPRVDRWLHRVARGEFIHLTFGFSALLLMSSLAVSVGLAAILGAFAAGLILSASDHREALFESLRPLGGLLTGLFFLVLGARVDLGVSTPVTPRLILAVVLLLALVGTVSKFAAVLGVFHPHVDRYVVAVGMVPRGGIGLIFAVFGLEHGLLANWQYLAIVLFVLLTTFATPPWLHIIRRRFGPATMPKPPPTARVAELGSA